MALTSKLSAIGDAIRAKTGSSEKLTLDQMASAISGITGGSGGGECNLPHIPLEITGDCTYMFYRDAWNWIINDYSDRITTKDIKLATGMFAYNGLSEIPFDLNLNDSIGGVSCNLCFSSSNLQRIPYIKGKLQALSNIFEGCSKLTEIQEDWADYIDWSIIHQQNPSLAKIFSGCQSLKRIPQNLIDNLYVDNLGSYSYSPYYTTYKDCYALEGLNNIPVVTSTSIVQSSQFYSAFDNCYRLKCLTFAVQEDGTPFTANWKNQTIDLTKNLGFGISGNLTGLSNFHGITASTQVTDDASYQALKDDPDWWTSSIPYGRYNHDSAVETINSLPDLSAVGGTNTIKFKGLAGSSTDGGAINTLTEEEIAVATAKGWTVTFA